MKTFGANPHGAVLVGSVLSLLLLEACDGTNVFGPENQPEITNNTDRFQGR